MSTSRPRPTSTPSTSSPAPLRASGVRDPGRAHGTGSSRWVALVACGVAALAVGLVVPVATLAEMHIAERTSLRFTVACLMPLLVGMTFWSATTMLSGGSSRPRARTRMTRRQT